MNKEYKNKAIELGKIMNSKSKFSIPLVKCILECFKIVFTEDDIDHMLMMGSGYYTVDELKELWKLDEATFAVTFASIRDKGGIWQSKGEGIYDIAPIFPGWVELYASGPSNETRQKLLLKFGEFEELLKSLNIGPVRAYMNHVNTKNMAHEPGRMTTIVSHGRKGIPTSQEECVHLPYEETQLVETATSKTSTSETATSKTSRSNDISKTITVNKTIEAIQTVYTNGEVMPLLDKYADRLAVMNCFCRMMKELEGGSCDYNFPMESCLAVGRMATQLVDAGVARYITYDEAVQLISELENKGCIHTLYHYGTDSANEEIVICNCCIDCCFLYSSFRQGALSQLLMRAYYRPEMIDAGECIGCNKCNRFCPTSATWYDKDKHELIFDYSKCIGCGQCVAQCPKTVRKMVRDERNVFVKTEKPIKKR